MLIAIVDKFSNSPYGFSKSLFEYLKTNHDITIWSRLPDNPERYDIIHFDWADEVTKNCIDTLSRLIHKPRITVRLHAYELHDGFAQNINWGYVDCLIFVSDHYKKLFENNIENKPKKMIVVNHGIDLDKFKLVEDRTGNNILYVGSINFKKGSQLLAQVAMAFPNRKLHVYGDIQCVRSKIYFDNLNLPNLIFLPYRKHIEDVMMDPQYKYILSTSLGESFHLAIAEGMACGLESLVHDWYGANELWPNTWKSIEELINTPNMITSKESRKWIEDRYDSKKQLSKLGIAITGEIMNETIAVCMITKDCFKGVKRALESCHSYVDAVYIAVDNRDEDNTLEQSKQLIKELKLDGNVEAFEAPEPWDFSYARNIAHGMNKCNWAFVLDDDEHVLCPEEIPKIIEEHKDKDIIDITCGIGLDEYGNVSQTWKFTRFMRNHVRWINARHNIPDKSTYKTNVVWNGNIIIIDDKSIKSDIKRTERSTQRNTNIEEFRERINKNPNDTRSLFYLAIAYRESGKYWEAIHWYKQYLNTGGWDEERWQACYDLAVCQLALKRYSEARNSLHDAVKERSNRAEAFILMGDIFYMCQNFTESIIWYKLGCSLPYPSDARLFVKKSLYDWERYDKLSMAFGHVDLYGEAIEQANKALEKRPEDTRIKNNIDAWERKIDHGR